MSADQNQAAPQSTWDAAKNWISNNKLKTIFGIWAGGIGGTLIYEWSKPSAVSVKVIHARVVAQALTLLCLAGAAGADYLEHRSSTTNELEIAKERIISLEKKIEEKIMGSRK